MKKMEDLSADSLILTCKIIFSECGLPKKIVLDAPEHKASNIVFIPSPEQWAGGSMH